MFKVQHFEIPAADVERAKKFYEEVMGWRVSAMPAADMEYWGVYTTEIDDQRMPKEAGAINGGLYKKMRENEVLTVYATVDSIDDVVQKVTAHGGRVIQPKTTVGDMGFSARIADPEGNVVGIWEMMKK